MCKTEFSSKISLLLLSSISYVLTRNILSVRKSLVVSSNEIFLKHSISLEPDHLYNLIAFLEAGGGNNVPCLSDILENLLNQCQTFDDPIPRVIGLILSIGVENLFTTFWNWFSIQEVNLGLVSLLGETSIYCNLSVPKSPNVLNVLNNVQEICFSHLDQEQEPFHVIESCLTTLRWMIKVKLSDPFKIPIDYKSFSLKAIVIESWAFYAEYGKLDLIPNFPPTDNVIIQQSYSKIIKFASKNPEFSFEKLHISYWVWDEILAQFSNQPLKIPSSILNLSSIELDSVISFAYILPEYFFIHAIHARISDTSILPKFIKLVSRTPSRILMQNLHDFFSFIDFCIESIKTDHSQILSSVLECIHLLIYTYKPKLGSFIEVLSNKLHYIGDDSNTFSSSARILIINELLRFCDKSDVQSFLNIYEFLKEMIFFLIDSIPLTILISSLEFFISISPFININNQLELAYLAASALFSLIDFSDKNFYNSLPPLTKTNPDGTTYVYCSIQPLVKMIKQSYSFISSDLLIDPNYSVSKSFPLTSPALRLLNQLHPAIPISQAILQILPIIAHICPIEVTSLAIHYIQFAKINNFSLSEIHEALNNEVSCNSNPALISIFSVFSSKISIKIASDRLVSNLSSLPKNENLARLYLQVDSILFPLLLTDFHYFFFMVENWIPSMPEDFSSCISLIIEKGDLSWKNELIGRLFLQYIKFPQPPTKRKNTWIEREFFPPFYSPSSLRLSNPKASMSTLELIHDLGLIYPIPIFSSGEKTQKKPKFCLNQDNDITSTQESNQNEILDKQNTHGSVDQTNNINHQGEIILSLVRNYWKVSDPLINNYLEFLIIQNLKFCFFSKKGYENLDFLRFISSRKISFTLPDDVNDERCIALGLRIHSLSAEKLSALKYDKNTPSWLLLEFLQSNTQLLNPILNQINSVTLSALFLSKTKVPNITFIKDIFDRDIPSSISHLLFILSGFLSSIPSLQIDPILMNMKNSFIPKNISNPVVFRQILIFTSSLAIAIIPNDQKQVASEICDVFLQNTFGNPRFSISSAQLYQSFGLLTSIAELSGNSKGRDDLIHFFNQKEVSYISFLGSEQFESIVIQIQQLS